MPPREWRLRIEDILDAATRVARYVGGQDLATFVNEDLTLDTVSRCLGIIGEVARHIPNEVVAAHPGVPCWDHVFTPGSAWRSQPRRPSHAAFAHESGADARLCACLPDDPVTERWQGTDAALGCARRAAPAEQASPGESA